MRLRPTPDPIADSLLRKPAWDMAASCFAIPLTLASVFSARRLGSSTGCWRSHDFTRFALPPAIGSTERGLSSFDGRHHRPPDPLPGLTRKYFHHFTTLQLASVGGDSSLEGNPRRPAFGLGQEIRRPVRAQKQDHTASLSLRSGPQ